MPQVTLAEAKELLKDRAKDRKIFSVRFYKRTDKSIRDMVCQTRSPKDDGEPAYDFTEKRLLVVWDLQKHGYRSIPWEGIIQIRFESQDYIVRHRKEDAK